MVEQFPFKEAVLGSSPRGLTRSVEDIMAPSSSGLGRLVFIQQILGSNPNGVTVPLGSRLMVGQQPLELFILGSNPSSPAKCL
jgi:hypothetical protein